MESVYETLNIDRESAIPLYYQFKQFIIQNINCGALKQGDLVPAEEELCRYYAISRPTLRQAFSELVHEGYLIRHRAKGTYISKPKINSKAINKIVQFHEEMEALNATYYTEIQDCQIVECDDEIKTKLLLPDHKAIHLDRLRIVNGEPLVNEETFIPAHLFPGMQNVDFSKESMYETMEQYGYKIGRVERSIQAIAADEHFSTLLKIEEHTPILSITTIGYSIDDVPVEHSIAYYRSDRYTIDLDIVTSQFRTK